MQRKQLQEKKANFFLLDYLVTQELEQAKLHFKGKDICNEGAHSQPIDFTWYVLTYNLIIGIYNLPFDWLETRASLDNVIG